MARMDEVERIVKRYEAWWEGRAEEPLLYLIFPRPGADLAPAARPWMSESAVARWTMWRHEMIFGQGVELTFQTGEWRYVSEAIDLLERYAEVTDYAAEGYPFLLPGLGPGCLAAFISGYSRYEEDTIWFSLPEPMEWSELLSLEEDHRSDYGKVAVEALRRLVDRVQDRYVVAMPDLGLGLDVLSSLRGVENLLMDLVDRPETVERGLHTIEAIWRKTRGELSELIDPGNHGCYAESMRYLAGRPTHISYSDFSAMISPSMFARFVKPKMLMEEKMFPARLAYHMDGPGQRPHLTELLRLDGLRAIQWVPGAGNPGTLSPRWNELYGQIIDAGKKVCLGGVPFDLKGLRRLLEEFPPEAFLIPMALSDREQAAELLQLL